MGRPKERPRTTHVRVEADVNELAKINLPLYSQAEIFKAGYVGLMSYNKAGEFIYGKNVWKKSKKR